MKEQVDLLISGATLVTVNPERHIIKDGAVAIHDGKIKWGLLVSQAFKSGREKMTLIKIWYDNGKS